MAKIKWTRSYGRLTRISRETNSSLNWIFVPGGPGLGSEIFEELTNSIKLPGVIWENVYFLVENFLSGHHFYAPFFTPK